MTVSGRALPASNKRPSRNACPVPTNTNWLLPGIGGPNWGGLVYLECAGLLNFWGLVGFTCEIRAPTRDACPVTIAPLHGNVVTSYTTRCCLQHSGSILHCFLCNKWAAAMPQSRPIKKTLAKKTCSNAMTGVWSHAVDFSGTFNIRQARKQPWHSEF